MNNTAADRFIETPALGFIDNPDFSEKHKNYEVLSYPELKKFAANRGVSAAGKREEIIRRLVEQDGGVDVVMSGNAEVKEAPSLLRSLMPEKFVRPRPKLMYNIDDLVIAMDKFQKIGLNYRLDENEGTIHFSFYGRIESTTIFQPAASIIKVMEDITGANAEVILA